ncbi:MAG: hypothetical protein AMK69_15160 [Nitrospira bacterium SG8_3]|nr:MAG: hypothetical protein AMK69_15160 [Nitrospira bacterium SG8_3]
MAGQFGISIRYDNLRDSEAPARSGLCVVKGRHLYIMDTSTTLSERIRLLTSCLSRMNFEERYVLPVIRELLEEARQGGAGADEGWTGVCSEVQE